jgi:hypothetical protein
MPFFPNRTSAVISDFPLQQYSETLKLFGFQTKKHGPLCVTLPPPQPESRNKDFFLNLAYDQSEKRKGENLFLPECEEFSSV